VYAHPVEHLVVNVIPLALGGIFMESHPLVFAIWITAAIFTVITTHSGFKFPGLPNPVPHDYHHQVLNANFGVLGILDTLHGTRGRFQQYLMKVTKDE
jgi:sterol desaturase/sphingolipid hydroxylase (fatty acid hydroxylase superfamily)